MHPFFSFVLAVFLFTGTLSTVHAQNTDNFLPNENVFDNLSVDLKVNGSDGPVSITVGERITISWESDGAKRCRGNWSKNDLRLNGKIAGKLSRSITSSVTVRIACIDGDGNREDDSVVLKITGAVPPPFKNPVSPLPPAPDQPTIISSCGEITKSGKYVLQNDISIATNLGSCVNIHDTNNVELDCKGYVVSGGNWSMLITDVSDFKITSCHFKSSPHTASLIITHGTNGEVSKSSFGESGIFAYYSENLRIINNIFRGVVATYRQDFTNRSFVSENNFTIVGGGDSIVSAVVGAKYGNGNKIVHNNIDGGAIKGDLNVHDGADDGIVVEDQNNAIIEGNTIKNNWDCGIETLGFIFDTRIVSNTSKNSGLCGIGGWYWNSWKGNTVSDNIIESAPTIFYFSRIYPLRITRTEDSGKLIIPAEEIVYFSNNLFERNRLLSPKHSTGVVLNESSQFSFTADRLPTEIPSSKVMLGNNRFIGNDFTVVKDAPIFLPQSMIIDGGGNICGKSLDPNYPLACGRGN